MGTYKHDNRHVQAKGDHAVQEEGEETDVVDLSHGNLGELPEDSYNKVHGGADRSKVVERDQRVHLELSRAQQTLHHSQADSLKGNTSHLVHETDEVELDFAKRGNDDTNDNRGDVEEGLEARRRHTQCPASEQDGDGGGGLEHLDEGHAEVQVGKVAADQRQAEKDANGYNCPQVDAPRHLDRLAPIKVCSVASQDLGHDGREDQVVGRQEDGIV